MSVALPDFSRVIWHSELARSVWAPRISRINQAWEVAEREAVSTGQRPACLIFAKPSVLPELARWAARRGLATLPLAVGGIADQYSATPKAVETGRPWQYRIVILQPAMLKRWTEAWGQPGADDEVGSMLGYPTCCRQFFDDVWVKARGVDTTWQMAERTDHRCREWARGVELRVDAAEPEANILLRWLGVRLVPHLPCSFACPPTITQAQQYGRLMRALGFAPEVDWLYEMLSWPAEWSALHGIAEVKTPVLTVAARTDPTATKLAVLKDGTRYPVEGAQGLKFPFRVVKGKVTDAPAFARSVTPVWELNGFGSQAAMDQAHAVVLSALPRLTGMLLDLGCGTGRLLERAAALGWKVTGVESDHVRAGAAQVPVQRGDALDPDVWDGAWRVVLFMPGRLLEGINAAQAERVRAALMGRSRYVLAYAYGDWLARYGGLGPLIAEAGLGGADVVLERASENAAAALLDFTRVA